MMTVRTMMTLSGNTAWCHNCNAYTYRGEGTGAECLRCKQLGSITVRVDGTILNGLGQVTGSIYRGISDKPFTPTEKP
jgi:hypothetical protein